MFTLVHKKKSGVCLGLFLSVVSAGGYTQSLPPASECPQPRFTGKAPDEYYGLKNPLQSAEQDLKAAERLYAGGPGAGCAICHGKSGDGKGQLAGQFNPRPRNFACAMTVNGIPDGQLFWIIRFGSPGTSMPGHAKFSDRQIWELVSFLRRLAK
jgi:mono/diheme cytochrome c family protein